MKNIIITSNKKANMFEIISHSLKYIYLYNYILEVNSQTKHEYYLFIETFVRACGLFRCLLGERNEQRAA